MKIIIIDDDRLVCQALRTILESDPEIEVPAMGYNGTDALSLYEIHHPDILLMDIRMGEMTGIDAGREILKSDPSARILYLTTFADNEYIIQALQIGAKGYLLKQNFECILPSIKAVSMGQSVFGNEIISKIPTLMGKPADVDLSAYGLTEKEMEIIILIAEGLSNREIAARSFLSEGTVRNYISVMLEKLQLRDRTQLAIFYYRNRQTFL
ncbi:response regulator transcription factor [Anaerobium acetethylicum]|uniref:Stage 0 sporulation protein A homolog n=1 Tax=Anaerobium acetethylicum TaxID=1619234 RepID=A0A1D3TU90_9FIRM|nr:response regulator transcription factor [Anaerobium acetethylicum]SCP97545.1 DNA-binding response regulator, NarL/FixJ family, contains REC and HTH domains [Anaerobium acetethylicum]